MDVDRMRDQRLAYLNSLFSEGYLDDQFKQVMMLQDADNPSFVIDLIQLYCQDALHILKELTREMAEERPDFEKVDSIVHQLKGSSASIGAKQVQVSCMDFHTFCEQVNRAGCIEALNMLQLNFSTLRDKLQVLIQLEMKIQAVEDGRV